MPRFPRGPQRLVAWIGKDCPADLVVDLLSVADIVALRSVAKDLAAQDFEDRLGFSSFLVHLIRATALNVAATRSSSARTFRLIRSAHSI